MTEEKLDLDPSIDTKEEIEEYALTQTDAWKNRRRMAYFSLYSIVIVTYWALFLVPESRLKILEEVITWFYFIMGSIVGAYVGFSTLDKKWSNKGGGK